MSSKRTNFIPLNEGFTCEQCQTKVSPAQGTFRNHCPSCLTAKHVDESIPGDRASNCGGLMLTIAYEGSDPDHLDLVQQCQQCGKLNRNKIARDDNKEKIFTLHHSDR